ncbi:MAG: endolytic transglycosylase MltG [Clostridiales bacterium]|nr:endolytic transglycosylase MltG [Clostridiales bacterium]
MKLNLKYYLRGLGLGIVVTAVIMCILNAGDDKMTNEEIIARAKQLGMIEDTVLTDGLNNENQDNEAALDKEQDDNGSLGEGQDDGTGIQTDNNTGLQNDNNTDLQTDGSENGDNNETGTEGQGDTEPQPAKPLLPDSWTGASTVEAAEAGTLDEGGSSDEEQDDDGMAEAGSQDEPVVFPKVLIISSGEGSYTVSKKLAQIGAVESAEEFDTYLCENGYDKKIRAGTYTIPVGATNEQMAKIVTGAKVTE